jgi:hypothetical protein
MATTDFPSPLPDDAEDVVLALDLGRSLWTKGDVREAVRWLRRAAAAAEATGNDVRGVRLAATAADIATEFSLTSITPPPPPVAKRSSGPPPLPHSAPPPLPDPTPPPVRVSARPPPLPVSPPPPPAKMSTKPPPVPATPSPPPPPIERAAAEPELPPEAPHASSMPPPVSHADEGGGQRRRAGALRSYRVYVEHAPEGGFRVHPLRDGDRPPTGTREAILVIADHGGSRHPPKGD